VSSSFSERYLQAQENKADKTKTREQTTVCTRDFLVEYAIQKSQHC